MRLIDILILKYLRVHIAHSPNSTLSGGKVRKEEKDFLPILLLLFLLLSFIFAPPSFSYPAERISPRYIRYYRVYHQEKNPDMLFFASCPAQCQIRWGKFKVSLVILIYWGVLWLGLATDINTVVSAPCIFIRFITAKTGLWKEKLLLLHVLSLRYGFACMKTWRK